MGQEHDNALYEMYPDRGAGRQDPWLNDDGSGRLVPGTLLGFQPWRPIIAEPGTKSLLLTRSEDSIQTGASRLVVNALAHQGAVLWFSKNRTPRQTVADLKGADWQGLPKYELRGRDLRWNEAVSMARTILRAAVRPHAFCEQMSIDRAGLIDRTRRTYEPLLALGLMHVAHGSATELLELSDIPGLQIDHALTFFGTQPWAGSADVSGVLSYMNAVDHGAVHSQDVMMTLREACWAPDGARQFPDPAAFLDSGSVLSIGAPDERDYEGNFHAVRLFMRDLIDLSKERDADLPPLLVIMDTPVLYDMLRELLEQGHDDVSVIVESQDTGYDNLAANLSFVDFWNSFDHRVISPAAAYQLQDKSGFVGDRHFAIDESEAARDILELIGQDLGDLVLREGLVWWSSAEGLEPVTDFVESEMPLWNLFMTYGDGEPHERKITEVQEPSNRYTFHAAPNGFDMKTSFQLPENAQELFQRALNPDVVPGKQAPSTDPQVQVDLGQFGENPSPGR